MEEPRAGFEPATRTAELYANTNGSKAVDCRD